MTVMVCRNPTTGDMILMARAAGGGALGDMIVDVRPGESALGKTYDEWAALGEGAHDVD